MNPPRFPRALITLLFILIASTFLVGTLRFFASAQAAPILEDSTQKNSQDSRVALAPTLTVTVNFSTLEPTLAAPTASLQPSPTKAASSTPTLIPTPTPTLIPIPPRKYFTDMTGIISLAIMLVVVILVGIIWGARSSRRKKEPK